MDKDTILWCSLVTSLLVVRIDSHTRGEQTIPHVADFEYNEQERFCCFLRVPFSHQLTVGSYARMQESTRGTSGSITLAHLPLANWIFTKRVDGIASSSGT
jgi:hypothetical protein